MKKYIILGAFLASSISSVSALSDISHSDFREYIINAQSENIISGYSDNTFRPNNPVSFIESLKMAINTGPQRKNIDTIPGQSWFMPFVDYYNNHQKVNSLYFSNNEYITRDFAIYLVLKQLGIDVDSTDMPYIPTMFSDIDNGTPLASYILFAKYAGIVSGYSDGAFGPKNRVSRGEFTKMLWKSLREDKSQIMKKYAAIKDATRNNTQGTNNTQKFTYEDIKKQGTIYCGKNRITLKNEPIIQVFSSNNTLITEVNNGFSSYNIACNNGEISFSANYGEALVGVMDYIHIDANGALQRQECTSEYSEVTGKIIQTTYRLNGKVTEIKNGNTTIGECVRIGDIISQQNPQSYTPVHLDTTNWNTYNNSKYNFSFQYPSNATLNMYEGDISPQGKKVNVAEMLMLSFPKGAVNIRLPGFETFHGWAPSMDGSGPLDVIVDGKKISKSYEFRGQSEPRVGKKEEWELQYYVSPDQLSKSFNSPEGGLSFSYYFTPEVAYKDGFEESFRDREIEATIESIIADIIR